MKNLEALLIVKINEQNQRGCESQILELQRGHPRPLQIIKLRIFKLKITRNQNSNKQHRIDLKNIGHKNKNLSVTFANMVEQFRSHLNNKSREINERC